MFDVLVEKNRGEWFFWRRGLVELWSISCQHGKLYGWYQLTPCGLEVPTESPVHDLPSNHWCVGILFWCPPLLVLLGKDSPITGRWTSDDQPRSFELRMRSIFESHGSGEIAASGTTHDKPLGPIGSIGGSIVGHLSTSALLIPSQNASCCSSTHPFVGFATIIQPGRKGILGAKAVVHLDQHDLGLLRNVPSEIYTNDQSKLECRWSFILDLTIFVLDIAGKPASGVDAESSQQDLGQM